MSIYMDNAATVIQKPASVAQAVYEALNSQTYGNPSRGAHGYSLYSFRKILETRKRINRLFNAGRAYEVAFSANSTTALNQVLKGLLRVGDHVLTTMWEHNSVLRPLYQLEELGVNIDFINSIPKTGKLLYEEFEQKLRPETKMVVCNHASNVTGNIIDLNKIKYFCQQHHLQLVLDASQTAGSYPLDMSDEIITALCFTGHKALGGPTGTGGVCLKKGLDIQPLLTGGSGVDSFAHNQPKPIPELLEAGTVNVAGIIGLSAAVDYLLKQDENERLEKQKKLAQQFLRGLRDIPDVTLYGDFTAPHLNVFSINIDKVDSALISDILWENYGIATRSGYHCAPLMHRALGTEKQGTVRFSFSNYTTVLEVEKAITSLREVAKLKRG